MRSKGHMALAGTLTALLAIASVLPVASSWASVARTATRTVSAPTWRSTAVLPGSAALNKGGDAGVDSVSCTTPGNCSAGGFYNDNLGNYQAFVADEAAGAWSSFMGVPGVTALNKGGDAETYFTSCSSPGACGAGGYYRDGAGHYQAFVTSSVKGAWRSAVRAPGTAGLNVGGDAAIEWGSCPSSGSCTAGGSYKDGTAHRQVFVLSEVGGVWHAAAALPGLAALNVGGDAMLFAVACASAGNCAAGGRYTDGAGVYQAFVANQVAGSWQPAVQVPGTATLNASATSAHGASINAISCRSVGNCSAAGVFAEASGTQAMVVDQLNGAWQGATEVPGARALNSQSEANLQSISCSSPRNCLAGGLFTDATHGRTPMVASEVNGTWQSAVALPGAMSLNKGKDGQVESVACFKAAACVAVGSYKDGSNHLQAMVASEAAGKWRGAQLAPGSSGLNRYGDASAYSVSCTSAGTCVAGGWAESMNQIWQATVYSFTPPAPTVTALSPSGGSHLGGTAVLIRGANLTGATRVLFGARPGSHLTVLNPTAIRVVSPPGTGVVDVRVVGLGGTSTTTAPDHYRYR